MEASAYKVSITCMGQTVTFEASSPVTESRTASWDQYNVVHLPTSLFAYRGTSHRSYQVSGKLVSRTPDEATINARYLNLIRSWVQPDFGASGATPPIVYLTAYANSNIKQLSCFVRTYSWQFTDEVDYIFNGEQPMPVIGVLSVDLEEIYSATEITQVTPWKIKDASGSVLSGSVPFSSLGNNLSFQGLATKAISAEQQISGLFNQIANADLSQNPLSSIVNNSPQLSSVTKGISSITNNQFISGVSAPVANQVPTTAPPPLVSNPNPPPSIPEGYTVDGSSGNVSDASGNLDPNLTSQSNSYQPFVVAEADTFGRNSLSNDGPSFPDA